MESDNPISAAGEVIDGVVDSIYMKIDPVSKVSNELSRLIGYAWLHSSF